MTARMKADLYALLKEAGGAEKHYRNYTVQELTEALNAKGIKLAEPPVSDTPDPTELAGQRSSTADPDEVIRVDSQGRQWYKEEVRKPAYPRPRGRRVLKYVETGVATETIRAGEYVETFEVAGREQGRAAEVRITLPSYQVGVYKDPRFPFKIHTYNGSEGFDLFEVEKYYGGPELIPPGVKRIYVDSVLCYDIRSVIRAIQAEYRQLTATGVIK